LHCCIDLVRNHGVPSLLTGFWVNTAREVVFCGVYFGCYELFKGLLQPMLSWQPLAIPLAGGGAGMLAWFASFPLDVVKSNVQGQRLDVPPEARLRFWPVVRERYRLYGVRGFYAGVVPSVARAFVVSSSRFAAYELAVSLLVG
jgi:solute carrier family 25 carnitine/acylcarnitine transporter 20/29